jgi:hypothetical protein
VISKRSPSGGEERKKEANIKQINACYNKEDENL